MAYPGKREGLAQKVDTAAQEAEKTVKTVFPTRVGMNRL